MDQGSTSEEKTTFTREEVDRLIRQPFAQTVSGLIDEHEAVRLKTTSRWEEKKRSAKSARYKAETLYNKPDAAIEELHSYLGRSSLDFAQYVSSLEETFGVRLSADEIRTMTLSQLVGSVEETLAEQGRLAKLVRKTLNPDELLAQRTADSAAVRGSRS